MASKLRLALLSLAMLAGILASAPLAGAVDTVPDNSEFGAQSTVAGSGGPGSGPNQLREAEGIALDQAGFLYVVDGVNARVQKVSPDGSAVTVAGGNGLGGAANQFHNPKGIAIDADGSIYIADTGNHRIQKVAVDGTVSTVAGGIGFGVGANYINFPLDVAISDEGWLLVVSGDRLQKVTANGSVSTILGAGFSGADANQLTRPAGVTIGPDGTIYVADTGNSRIQKIALDGTVTTVAGANGYGDGPTQLSGAESVAVSSSGNLYVADRGNRRIQRVLLDGTVSTVSEFEGDPFSLGPIDLLFDRHGSLYVSSRSRVIKLLGTGVVPEPVSARFGCSQKSVSSDFEVSWTSAPDDAVRFVVSRSVFGKYWVRGAVTDGSSLFADGPSPKNSAGVYYRVEAQDARRAVVGSAGCVVLSSDGLFCSVSAGQAKDGYRIDISGLSGTGIDYVVRRTVSHDGPDFWRTITDEMTFEDSASPTREASYFVWARDGKRIAAASSCVAITG